MRMAARTRPPAVAIASNVFRSIERAFLGGVPAGPVRPF
jgi:hypothetical protein